MRADEQGQYANYDITKVVSQFESAVLRLRYSDYIKFASNVDKQSEAI